MAYDTRQKTSQRNGYDIVGKIKREAATKYGGAASGPLSQPSQPVQPESQQDPSVMRDKLRMQIANEQQMMLAARRAGKTTKGVGADSDALERIANLRNEYGMYSDAARKPQAPNTPEKNFFANRDAANQAAKIMQNDVAAMEQKVYAMPAGPQRDAEVEKLRAFRSRANDQFVAGNVMRPEDVGPRVQGDTPDAYGSAMNRATQQTANQTASAARDMDRRQNVLKFAQGVTDKRLAGEQYSTDLTAAARQASIAGIRRPEDEFKLKSDQAMAEIDALRKKAAMGDKMAEAELAKTQAQTDAFRYGMNPTSPANRKESAQADLYAAQAAKEMKRVNSGVMNADEIKESDTVFSNAGAGNADVDGALGLLRSVMTQVSDGRYTGTAMTGNAEEGMRAVSKIGSVVQGLKSVASVNPDKARANARMMLAEMQQLAGANQPNTGMLAAGAGGAAAGAAIGSVVPGIGTAIGGAVGGIGAMLAQAFGANMNASQREMLVQQWNQMYSDLQRIAGQ